MSKTYIINENRIADIWGKIFVGFFLGIGIITFIFMLFGFYDREYPLYGLAIFFPGLLVSLVLNVIWSSFSTLKQQSKLYLNQIRVRIRDAKSLEELKKIEEDFRNETIDDNGMIRISYPSSVKGILNELKYKIDILEKIKL